MSGGSEIILLRRVASALAGWRDGKRSTVPFEQLTEAEQAAYLDQAQAAIDAYRDAEVVDPTKMTQAQILEILDLMGEAAYWANNGCGDPKAALPRFRPLMGKALQALLEKYELRRREP